MSAVIHDENSSVDRFEDLPDLLTKQHLAAMLGVTLRTIDRRAAVGDMPAEIKIGGTVRWRKATVLAWLAKREAPRNKRSR